jgi:hypothetical protein
LSSQDEGDRFTVDEADFITGQILHVDGGLSRSGWISRWHGTVHFGPIKRRHT